MSSQGLTVEAVQKVFDDFMQSFNGNFDVLPYIKSTQEEIYGPNASIEKLGFPIEGAYHPAQRFITLVAANLDNEEAARRTIRHELLGHYALNTFTPDQKRDLLTSVLESQTEPTLKPIWDKVNKHYSEKSPLERAEEVFAFVAEQESTFFSRAWDRVRASFQKALRVTGLTDRPLTLHELRVDAQIIAEGIKRGERELQTFPASDDAQFRIKDSGMDKQKKSFAEQVAENLIKQLEAGTAPWQKPWQPGQSNFMPMNPTTGKRYKGINALHLMAKGHDDPRWMTYNQASSLDAQVKKGEKGTTVQYWKFSEEQDKLDEQGRPVLDDKGKKVKETVKLERPRVFFATVFNAEQIDGLPAYIKPEQPDNKWTPIERAEMILEASGATIKHNGGDRAFYRPSTDSIHLPDKSQFPTADNYYATALHELGHWTGHQTRLDRDLGHPFGSEMYAKEELRAEIASMILGDELGIGHDPEQHAAYVKSWVKALKDDPNEIFRAAADAEKIQDFVLGLEQQRIKELDKEQLITTAQQEQHEEILARARANHATSNEGYSPLDTWENLAAVAEKNGYSAMMKYPSVDDGIGDVEVIYKDGDKTLPVVTQLALGDGKAVTLVYDERVQGTGMTSDTEWQQQALDSAFETYRAVEQMQAQELETRLEEITSLREGHAKAVQKLSNTNDPLALNFYYELKDMAEQKGVNAILTENDNGFVVKFEKEGYLLDMDTEIVPNAQNALLGEAFASARAVSQAISERTGERKELEQTLETLQPQLRQMTAAEAIFGDEQAGDWLIESQNGTALSSSFHNEEDAKAEAKKIADLSNAIVMVKKGVMDTAEFDQITESCLGHNAKIFEPENWTGRLVSRPVAEFTDTEGQKYIEEVPLNEAQFLGLYTGHIDGRTMHVADFTNPGELDAVRMRLEAVKYQVEGIELALDKKTRQAMPEDAISSVEQGLPPMNPPLKKDNERTLINVPFKEKNEAKSLGAKWDTTERSWFIPAGVDTAPFAKWMNDGQGQTATAEPAKEQSQSTNQGSNSERVYLAVPYAERAAAKAAGAKWDKQATAWYADQNADLKQLRQYLIENNTKTGPTLTPREELSDALKTLGAIVEGEHPIMDGKKHRIRMEGDKPSEKSGFYVAFADQHPAGYIKNNRTGQEVKWKSKGYSLTDEERAAMQAEAATKLAERAKAEAIQHDKVSAALTVFYNNAPAADPQATYLQNKGIEAVDIRVVPAQFDIQTDPQIMVGKNFSESKTLRENNPDAIVFTAGELLVPAQDANNQLWQVQAVQANGSKRFASGGKKEGAFFPVGGMEALDAAPVIIIGEGYATAKSLSEGAGMATVAAFDSGNLEKVALAMRERYPDKPIIVAGDDDHSLESKPPFINVGKEKAKAAAKAVGGEAILPIFAPGEKEGEHGAKLTDFNDLAQKSVLGREAVGRQVNAVVRQALAKQQEQQIAPKIEQEQEQKRVQGRGR